VHCEQLKLSEKNKIKRPKKGAAKDNAAHLASVRGTDRQPCSSQRRSVWQTKPYKHVQKKGEHYKSPKT
jgi:hypothetical protein